MSNAKFNFIAFVIVMIIAAAFIYIKDEYFSPKPSDIDYFKNHSEIK